MGEKIINTYNLSGGGYTHRVPRSAPKPYSEHSIYGRGAMTDSEISFDYDDDDSFLALSDSDFSDSESPPSLCGPLLLNQVQAKKSPNFLSDFMFRPLRMLGYLEEHYLSPARALQVILPKFSMDELLVILQYKKWLVNEVTSDYYDNWPRLRDQCGLGATRGTTHCQETRADFFCSICCELGPLEVFLLQCGHEYCVTCYQRYVKANVRRGKLLRCINLQCNLSIVPSDVELLLLSGGGKGEVTVEESSDDSSDDSSEEAYERQFEKLDLSGRFVVSESRDPILSNRYLLAAARVDIDSMHSKYRWCPAVDCNNVVEAADGGKQRPDDVNLANVPIVTCTDAHEFCFRCQYENHVPCPCWLVKKWIKRCEDDSETANWIEANTQSCPRCHTQIEKNGGCNHMKCQKCMFEFCWICFGAWDMHQSAYWKCNRYDPKEVEQVKKKKSDKQASLSRYLHFYKRFCVHQTSIHGDQKTLRSVYRCMFLYMKAQRASTKKSVSWNDVQYLSDAIRSLSSGRKTLMWTYAFAFYLERSNFAEIFEGMQDYLTKTVEDLSRLFEELDEVSSDDAVKRITKRKTDIVNLSALVTRRQHLLIECAHSGLLQETLKFRDI